MTIFLIVQKFCYLDSVITCDCTDTLNVHRIKKAGKGGVLSSESKSLSFKTKWFVYQKIVLTILLYCTDSCFLTEALIHELSCYHSRC